jgi:hypothetical protein
MGHSNAYDNDITPIRNSCKVIFGVRTLSPGKPSGSTRMREVLTPELDPINLIAWTSDLPSNGEIDDE